MKVIVRTFEDDQESLESFVECMYMNSNIEIKDIKFSTCERNGSVTGHHICYSCLILYIDKEPECPEIEIGTVGGN